MPQAERPLGHGLQQAVTTRAHSSPARNSFIRLATSERRTFERMLANLLPNWDASGPARLPPRPPKMAGLVVAGIVVVGVGIAGLIAGATAIVRRAPRR
jgi:hypothetical protein